MENAIIKLIEPCEYGLQIKSIGVKDNITFNLIGPCYNLFTFVTEPMFTNVINIFDICNTTFVINNIGNDFDSEIKIVCFTIDNEIYFITKDFEHFKTSLDQFISVKKI